MELEFKDILCPVCGSNNYKILFRDKNRRELLEIETNTVKCTVCGMVYLNPLPDETQFLAYYEKIFLLAKEISSTSDNKKEELNAVKKLTSYLEKITNIIFPLGCSENIIYQKEGNNKNVLDIGCNNGEKLKYFIDRGYNVYGVDCNPKAIEEAQKNIPQGSFACGTIYQIDLPHDFFDYIRLDNVFEHIYEPRDFLLYIKKLLKPQGKLVLYIPSISSWQFHILGKFYVVHWIPFHINLFSKATIRLIAEKTGYHVEKMYNVTDYWWTILSFRQLTRCRRKKRIDFSKSWKTKLAYPVLAPFLWIANKLGNADMLIVVLKK